MGKRPARQIMVSRIHVDYLDLRRTMAENMRVLEERLHSVLPLCDGGMDKVFGVVHTKEFLMAYEDDGDPSVMQLIARPPTFVPEKLSVDKLLPAFYEHQTQMLFLVSEYGGVEGIVTLQDVVDELLREAAEADNPGTTAAQGAAVEVGRTTVDQCRYMVIELLKEPTDPAREDDRRQSRRHTVTLPATLTRDRRHRPLP